MTGPNTAKRVVARVNKLVLGTLFIATYLLVPNFYWQPRTPLLAASTLTWSLTSSSQPVIAISTPRSPLQDWRTAGKL